MENIRISSLLHEAAHCAITRIVCDDVLLDESLDLSGANPAYIATYDTDKVTPQQRIKMYLAGPIFDYLCSGAFPENSDDHLSARAIADEAGLDEVVFHNLIVETATLVSLNLPEIENVCSQWISEFDDSFRIAA